MYTIIAMPQAKAANAATLKRFRNDEKCQCVNRRSWRAVDESESATEAARAILYLFCAFIRVGQYNDHGVSAVIIINIHTKCEWMRVQCANDRKIKINKGLRETRVARVARYILEMTTRFSFEVNAVIYKSRK